MNGKSTIKTILVIVILILVGVLGVFGLNTAKTYMSGASVGYDPKGVAAKSADDGKSATITWTTEKPVMAIVEYGTTPASLLLRAIEPNLTSTHSVTISPLKPNVSYYYRIRVREKNDEDTIYDNSGIPFSFKTKASDTADGGVVNKPTTSVPTMSQAAPTIALNKPTPAGIGTSVNQAASTGACNRTTDYNKDGAINSMDYMSCLKTGGSQQATPSAAIVPTSAVATTSGAKPTGVSACKEGTDYNKDGAINVMDMIKCRQDASK